MRSLDTSLGFLMTRAARGMKRVLDARLSEHNLTSTQYIVLARLWEGDGISITELCDRLYIDNPTLTGIVDRMERDGVLERRRDRGDRRVVNVYLTEKGKNLRQAVGDFAEETDAEAWDGFTVSEKKTMLDALNLIWKRMSESLD
jgi:DNA-binding MarR family transcriptional regulator